MKNLLYKEFRLAAAPAPLLFILLGAMLLIPSYPYFVGISYFIFIVQIFFQSYLGNRDLEFTSMLPISRAKMVLSKTLVVVVIQLMQLAFAAICGAISSLVVNTSGNPVGMDANLAFFGFAFIAYSVFNIFFLTGFFKTGTKAGIPLLLALVAYLITVLATELIVQFVPALNAVIDGLNPAYIGYRAIVLVVGILFYAASTCFVYKKSVKRFEQVNL